MHSICDRIARQIGGQLDLAQRLLLADLQLPQRTKARTEVQTTPCKTGVELGDVKGLRALRPHIGEQYAGRHGTSTASQPGGDVAHPCAGVIGTGIVLVRRTAERHRHDTVACRSAYQLDATRCAVVFQQHGFLHRHVFDADVFRAQQGAGRT